MFGRLRHPDALVALLLLALAIGFLWDVTLAGKVLLPLDNLFAIPPYDTLARSLGIAGPHNFLISDAVLQNIWWKSFARESLLRGEIPLWNPYTFSGVPFLAAGQYAVLYPLGVLFYLLPVASAYGWFTALHLFLAGLFTYVFLRVIGVVRFGAIISAVAFMFSLVLVTSFLWPMVLSTAVWTPLLLALIELTIRDTVDSETRGTGPHPDPLSAPICFSLEDESGLGKGDSPFAKAEACGYGCPQDRDSASGAGVLAPFTGARDPLVAPQRRFRTRMFLWPILASIALGFQFLAGHMEYSFYVLFTMAYFAACRLVVSWWTTRRTAATVQAFFLLLAFVALGAGLAGVQLVPFQEVIRENFRSGFTTYEDVIGWALPKMQVLSFIMPDFFGNPAQHTYLDFIHFKTVLIGDNALGQPTDPPSTVFWGIKNYVEAASYVGILPLVLAVVAVLWRRNRYTWIFLLYALFSLLLAFGSPLYAIFFFGIPGFDQLHTPFRWVYPYTISIVILAGIGAGALVQPEPDRHRTGMQSRPRLDLLGKMVLAVGVAMVLGLVASLVASGHSVALADTILQRSDRLKQDFASGQMLFSYEFRNILILALLLAASGAIILLSQREIHYRNSLPPAPPLGGQSRPPLRFSPSVPPCLSGALHLWLADRSRRLSLYPLSLWQVLAITILVVDLFVAGYNFNSRTDPRLQQAVPESISFLQKDESIFRVTSFGTEDILKPNLAMGLGLQDIRGYDTIILRRYVDFWKSIEEPHGLLYSMIKTLDQPSSLDSRLLDLMNVKYVLTRRDVNAEGFRLVHDGDLRIYENTQVQPRAFLVDRIIPAENHDNALAWLRDPSFDPRREVILEKWPPDHGLPPGDGSLPVPKIRAYGANAVTLDVDAPRSAILVLSDTFFAGWQARVDGQEVEIFRANATYRAIEVPAGSHVVEFKYSPLSFKIGLLASFVSLVVVVCALGMFYLRRLFSQPSLAVQRVARNSLTPMATQLLNKAVDVAFAMLMLRLLGPENIGKYTFAIIVIGYFEILTNFGLNTLLTREVARDRSLGNKYLTNTALLRLLLTTGSAPIIALFLVIWGNIEGLDAPTTWAIVLLAIALVPSNISAALSSLFYAHERMEYPAAVSVVTTLLKVTLGVAALLAGWGFVGLAAVSIAVNVLTALIFAVLVSAVLFKPHPEVDLRLTKEMIGTSWPLMINHLLATLFFRIDIVLLEYMKGPTIVGYYATAYKFIDGLNIIPSTLTIALFPVLSRYAESSRESFTRAYVLAVRLLVMVAVPIAVATAFLAEPIVLLFGGDQYLPHSAIALQVVIWFLPFSYVNGVTQYVLIALNQQRFITISFVVAATFNIAANLALIPTYGYVGASIVTICSEAVLLVPFLYCVRRRIDIRPLLKVSLRPLASGIVMAGVLGWIGHANPFLVLLLGGGVYVASLAALGTFTADDVALARRLLGREKAPSEVETA